jgi:hypothetical protein
VSSIVVVVTKALQLTTNSVTKEYVDMRLIYLSEIVSEEMGVKKDIALGWIMLPSTRIKTTTCRKVSSAESLLLNRAGVVFVDSCYAGFREECPVQPNNCSLWAFDIGDTPASVSNRVLFHSIVLKIKRGFHDVNGHATSSSRHQQRKLDSPQDSLLNKVPHSLTAHIDDSPLDYAMVENRAKILYEKDPYTPIMLSILDELFLRKRSQWFASRAGLDITSSKQLLHRFDLSRSKHKRDCRRKDALLLMCVITKYDDIDLQEWLVWQIVIVGAHHIIVYVNIPVADNTLEVLRPFQEAGYVSVVEIEGSGQQPEVNKDCVSTIAKKACHYPGYGPIAGNGSEHIKNCAPHEDPDIYQGKDRVVWLSAFDSDEFALSMDGSCMNDELMKYNITTV